jgi:hypothetical protein
MRSTLDVRLCHYLRAMRAMAPLEWNEGLPFPSCAAPGGGWPAWSIDDAVEQPEVLNALAYLDRGPTPRFAGAVNRIEISRPAIGDRIAVLRDALSDLCRRSLKQFDLRQMPRLDRLRSAS